MEDYVQGQLKLQFKVDNGEWTDTLPRYNKEMAQTIITRCACEEGEAKVYSQTSTPKTTNPAKCPCDCGVRNLADETAPTVIINNNSCIFGCIPTEGLISRGGGLCQGQPNFNSR
ncbi:MAG: hypothetical protein IPG79_08460 [Saprospiraceae bacterium]|nr:hypothetical protein [Saprospiraceae bacterium]